MSYKKEEVEAYRKSNLDHKAVTLLLEATAKISTVKVESDKCNFMGLLADIYFIKEYRYFEISRGKDLSQQEFLSLHLNPKSDLYSEIAVLKSCTAHAEQCKEKYGALSAKEFLKINIVLLTNNRSLLTEPLNDVTSTYIDDLWEILYELYNPLSEIPTLIRLALFYYELESFNIPIHFSLKQMILNYMLNGTFVIDHQSLFSSYRLIIEPLSKDSLDNFVADFLNHISNITDDKLSLINLISANTLKIVRIIKECLPKLYNDNLVALLGSNLTLNNNIAQNKLRVSVKTAISYLKQLEDVETLSSMRVGKELYYLRKDMIEDI